MGFSETDIEQYLDEVKDAVRCKHYKLEQNPNRRDNEKLLETYLLKREDVANIILSLTPQDFSKAVWNEHPGFEHELLYIFGKEVVLVERFGTDERRVPLYIKFNKLENKFVIVVSFHEACYPLGKYFK